jgi:hypothetical protein
MSQFLQVNSVPRGALIILLDMICSPFVASKNSAGDSNSLIQTRQPDWVIRGHLPDLLYRD